VIVAWEPLPAVAHCITAIKPDAPVAHRCLSDNFVSRSLFTTAISHLRNACGTYASYGEGLIGNSNQYIERVDLIIKKLSRQGG
ncbi:MAG: hypothetical protein P8Y29_07690, partial [Gemmatimonadota bacterium]